MAQYKIDWTQHRVIEDMQTATYKGEYLRIHKRGEGDFVGFCGDLQMEFVAATFQEVEDEITAFLDCEPEGK